MIVSSVFASTPAAERIAQIRSRIGADQPQAFARQLQAYTVGEGAAAPASAAAADAGIVPSAQPSTTAGPASLDMDALAAIQLGVDVPYAVLFESAGREHGVPAALLAAVAEVESAFDPNAVSPAGARGLMQFMPATAAEMSVDPFDPASAIDGAARYLRRELDRFGSLDLALAAYNAGPGAVQRYAGIPPFAETQAYVRKVNLALENHR